MTARNIPCHKCFPKASTFVTLSADEEKKKKKTSPQPSDGVRLSLFWMCQQFLAGWPDTAPWRCLPCVCVVCVCMTVALCVCVCLSLAYVCLNIFTSLCFFFFYPPALLYLFPSTRSRRKRAMSFLHKLIRGYTQERAAAARTSLIMLMRSPGDAVIEV